MRSANSVNEEIGQGVLLFQSVIDCHWQARAEAKYLSFVSTFGSCGMNASLKRWGVSTSPPDDHLQANKGESANNRKTKRLLLPARLWCHKIWRSGEVSKRAFITRSDDTEAEAQSAACRVI